jgi:hypothetical protein
MGINAGKLTKCFFAVGYGSFFPKILQQSIGKGNLCTIVVICMAKTNNQQGYKTSIQHQNRKKYETTAEEIRLQLTQVM